MIENINKKRKMINLLSLTITVILFLTFLLIIYLYSMTHFYISIIACIVLIASLYCLSRFIIKPMYNNLVNELFNIAFKDKYNNSNIVISKNSFDILTYLFNKDYYSLENKTSIECNDKVIEFCDFNYKENKANSKQFYGKCINITFSAKMFKKQGFYAINKDISEPFNNYLANKFTKIDNFSNRKNTTYKVFSDESYNYLYMEALSDISSSTFCIINENTITLFYENKEDGFNFKLNNKLKDDVIYYIKDCYSNMFKTINKLIEVSDKDV